MVFEEGGEGDGEALREELGLPVNEAARKKWFLTEANRKKWTWEAGRTCYGDFFNPYLDFNGLCSSFSFFMFLVFLGIENCAERNRIRP